MRSILAPLCLGLCLGTQSLAQTFYVDAIHGSDDSSGDSPHQAWKTLVHALNTLEGSQPEVIVFPGDYGTGTSLTMPPGVAIRAAEGLARPRILDTKLRFAGGFFPRSLERFDLIGSRIEVDVLESSANVAFTDVSIQDAPLFAISIDAFQGSVSARLNGITVRGSEFGIRIGGGDSILNVEIEDSLIEHCGTGIRSGARNLDVRRTTVRNCAEYGIWCSPVDGERALILDCLVHDNRDVGVWLEANAYVARFGIQRCTIARNGGVGLVGNSDDGGQWISEGIEGNIIALNSRFTGRGIDFEMPTFEGPIINNLIQDGSLDGLDGNFAADPLFVGSGVGDFRLANQSPAIDRLPSSAELDLLGFERSFDGNLDLMSGQDLGAIEALPLQVVGQPAWGTSFELTVRGEPGGNGRVLFSRNDLLDPPLSTPFGDSYLRSQETGSLGGLVFDAQGLATISINLPSQGWPNGLLGLQSLVQSSASPQGAALSNPILLQLR